MSAAVQAAPPPDEAEPALPLPAQPRAAFGSAHLAGRIGVTVPATGERVRVRFTAPDDGPEGGWGGWLTPSQAVQLAQNLLAAAAHCPLPRLSTTPQKADPA